MANGQASGMTEFQLSSAASAWPTARFPPGYTLAMMRPSLHQFRARGRLIALGSFAGFYWARFRQVQSADRSRDVWLMLARIGNLNERFRQTLQLPADRAHAARRFPAALRMNNLSRRDPQPSRSISHPFSPLARIVASDLVVIVVTMGFLVFKARSFRMNHRYGAAFNQAVLQAADQHQS
jgi:hypothetical protein